MRLALICAICGEPFGSLVLPSIDGPMGKVIKGALKIQALGSNDPKLIRAARTANPLEHLAPADLSEMLNLTCASCIPVKTENAIQLVAG